MGTDRRRRVHSRSSSRFDLIPQALGVIVGLHYLPLGKIFRAQQYYWTGAVMVAARFASPTAGPDSEYRRMRWCWPDTLGKLLRHPVVDLFGSWQSKPNPRALNTLMNGVMQSLPAHWGLETKKLETCSFRRC